MKARQKAWEIIKRVHLDNAHASLIMRHGLKDYSSLDQALIQTLVYGTLKNYQFLRYQWQSFLKNKIDEDISLLIDMAVFQLIFLDKIPNHAVVNETIEISKKVTYGKYRRLVTAILHRFIKEGKQQIENYQALSEAIQNGKDQVGLDVLEALALDSSHPLWLVKLWQKQIGFSHTVKLCYYNNQNSRLEFRVNTLKSSLDKILNNPDFVKHPLATNAVIYQKNIFQSNYFKNREVVIQSASSQKVAELVDLNGPLNVLDMCSAPGGKAFHLASLMNNQGKILAVDIHPHRIKLIENEMVLQNVKNVATLVADATKLKRHELGEFDAIILDAPCSGFGVLRSKPEIKIHTKFSDIKDLVKLQAALLKSASQLLKIGGQLIYATCTINELENQAQIQQFLEDYPNFSLEKQQLLLPFEVDSDGFYLAKLKRIS